MHDLRRILAESVLAALRKLSWIIGSAIIAMVKFTIDFKGAILQPRLHPAGCTQRFRVVQHPKISYEKDAGTRVTSHIHFIQPI